MGEVLELLKSLDGPSKAAAAFLVVLVGLALRLFPNETSVRVKLVVFFPFVTLQDASRVPRSGEALTTRGGTDVYDAEPRFKLFSQSWKLGSKVGTVNGGERLSVLAAPVFVGQDVWCRVAS
jgi:hypothetical protein